MSTAQTIAATDGLLVLKECPDCGYSLVGLPLEGTCPECGQTYAQGTVILRGWGRGRMANFLTAPTRIFALMSLPWVFALLCAALSLNVSAVTLRVPSFLGFMFMAAFTGIEIAWRANRGVDAPPMQVRLNALGCAQSLNLDRQRDALQILLTWLMPGVGVAYFAFQVLILKEPIPWALLFFMIAIGLAVAWTRRRAGKHDWRRYWREPAAVALITKETGAEPTLWTKVRAVSLQRVGQDRCRLRVFIFGGWTTVEPIDFEFRADDVQIAELERQIESWRKSIPITSP